MRTFIAVEMPKEVKDYLFKLQKKISGAKVNWVAKKNLHLTLKFIGDINEEQAENVRQELKKIKFKPFKVKLGNVGFFPVDDSPRVVWVELIPSNPIIELQRMVDSATLNVSVADTRFQSHITLGRIKAFKNKREFKNSVENTKVEPLQFEISEFKLFKSILSKDGPSYTVLDNFK